jgi:hypothetical protein
MHELEAGEKGKKRNLGREIGGVTEERRGGLLLL